MENYQILFLIVMIIPIVIIFLKMSFKSEHTNFSILILIGLPIKIIIVRYPPDNTMIIPVLIY